MFYSSGFWVSVLGRYYRQWLDLNTGFMRPRSAFPVWALGFGIRVYWAKGLVFGHIGPKWRVEK